MSSEGNASELSAKEFYAGVLSEAHQLKLCNARKLTGVDEEIALLRVKLRELAEKNPDSVDLLYKGVNALTKAVALQYKLSPAAKNDLYDSIVGVVNGIGRELWPVDGQ